MAVDQQSAGRVGIGTVPGEMDLAHDRRRDCIDPRLGREIEVRRTDEDVVHVDEKAAAGPRRELRKEGSLIEFVSGQIDIK